MTPARSDDLTPVLFKDFSGGLWERGSDRECPSNGLLEAQDCMPLPSGGLRAAWAWTEESLVGLPVAKRKIAGFQVNQNPRIVAGFQQVAVMLGSTGNSSGFYERWSAIGSDPSGMNNITPWSSGQTHLSLKNMVPVTFKAFNATSVSSIPSWYYNVADSISTASAGVWRPLGDLASTATVHVYTANVWYLTPHQNRLIYVVTASGGSMESQLIFTEPSTEGAPPSSNVLNVNADRAGGIHWLDPAFPNDLFVLKYPEGAYVVQGDIAAGPIVRDTLNLHVPETYSWGTRIPGGMVYMTEHEGIWMWGGGEQTISLSPQFVGSPMATKVLGSTRVTPSSTSIPSGVPFLGALGLAGRWLFTPKGYVYDLSGQFWFRSTLPSQDSGVVYPFWSTNEVRGRIYGGGSLPAGGTVRIISASINESNMTRSGTFQATLPIIDTTERNVELRRIEIFGQGFGNGGTWQLELTNDKGQTETTDPLQVQARAASVRANTKLQGDWLKVRLLSEGHADASSSTGKSEAPMVERIVLYLRSRQTRAA